MMTNSSALITDMGTIVALTPNATSTANAIAAAGAIMDLPGQLKLALLKLQEVAKILADADANVDSGDPIQSTLTNIRNVLV